MKRRLFLKASVLAGAIGSVLPEVAGAASSEKESRKKKREFYELRSYTLKTADQQKLVEDYFRNAAIPALNRLGSKAVGVFREMKPQGQTGIYVLIPFDSLQDFVEVQDKLNRDEQYLQAAASYLKAPAKTPAYERIESSLFRAFSHIPRLEAPGQKPRIFELRRYESASEDAFIRKVRMFNEGGEIAIFRRTGLNPVFFGEALIGSMLPNLTYMVSFDDEAAKDKAWKQFGSDPEWKRISPLPEYADTVSRITSTMLVPTDFSQI